MVDGLVLRLNRMFYLRRDAGMAYWHLATEAFCQVCRLEIDRRAVAPSCNTSVSDNLVNEVSLR